MRRLLIVLAAVTTVAVPTSIAVVAAAPAASAHSSLTCAKLKGTELGTVEASHCSVIPTADKKTYKDLSGNSTQLATGGTLKWTGGATVIVGKPTLSSPTGGCKATKPGKAPTQTEELAVGTVLGGTSVLTHAGDQFRAEVCLTIKTGKVALVKGTSISL